MTLAKVISSCSPPHIQTFNPASFLVFLEESRQLREVNDKEQANMATAQVIAAFNDENESPSSISTRMNRR